jgi:small multidrug resistance family-3 protein
LKIVDGEKLSVFDWTGTGIALLGMAVIVFGWTMKE